ncbi:MAG TPA: hypothetical protein VGL71_00815 [Urbifossiella sp.]
MLVSWCAVGVLLIVHLPTFLCLSLPNDTNLYDLIARRVLAGDTPYRDLMDVNFPGVVWIHMIVRSLFGWRPEVLRAFDFAVVSASAVLLVRWLPRSTPAWGRVLVGGVILAFYLSTIEWCHCQRDPWMLLPCLIALQFRAAQTRRLSERLLGFPLFTWAIVEGATWGVAFWIKPYIAIPALACWLASARLAFPSPGAGRRLAIDLGGLLLGGIAVGAIGIAWLIGAGAWPAFLEIMLQWNTEYIAFEVMDGPWWIRPVGLIVRFFPWMFVHMAAIPVALSSVLHGKRSPAAPPMLSTFYLAWLLQAWALQHMWDYIHVPTIMLGIAVLGCYGFARRKTRSVALALALLAVSAVLPSFKLGLQRCESWADCLNGGSTFAMRDKLARYGGPNWTDLERVADFLREQKVGDGEVSCFPLTTTSLYTALNIRPSTRHLFLHHHWSVFRSRRAAILATLIDGRQRFVVCDLQVDEMRESKDDFGGISPKNFGASRLVYRAGDYVVFRIDGREMPDWVESNFAR